MYSVILQLLFSHRYDKQHRRLAELLQLRAEACYQSNFENYILEF